MLMQFALYFEDLITYFILTQDIRFISVIDMRFCSFNIDLLTPSRSSVICATQWSGTYDSLPARSLFLFNYC